MFTECDTQVLPWFPYLSFSFYWVCFQGFCALRLVLKVLTWQMCFRDISASLPFLFFSLVFFLFLFLGSLFSQDAACLVWYWIYWYWIRFSCLLLYRVAGTVFSVHVCLFMCVKCLNCPLCKYPKSLKSLKSFKCPKSLKCLKSLICSVSDEGFMCLNCPNCSVLMRVYSCVRSAWIVPCSSVSSESSVWFVQYRNNSDAESFRRRSILRHLTIHWMWHSSAAMISLFVFFFSLGLFSRILPALLILTTPLPLSSIELLIYIYMYICSSVFSSFSCLESFFFLSECCPFRFIRNVPLLLSCTELLKNMYI